MDPVHETILRELEAHSRELPAEPQQYWRAHERRYAQLLETLGSLYCDGASGRPRPRRILDVGPSYQTLLLARLFPEAHLTTLGFEDARYKPSEDTQHIGYDLNDAYFRDSWPGDEGYDLIVMLEVVEHLYTAPRRVLGLLRSLSTANGLVVVSTPNALFLKNRLNLLLGRNPFEMLVDERHRLGLGHFREYTSAELAAAGGSAGLKTLHVEFSNVLLDRSQRDQRFYDRITRLLPAQFRQMTTMVFENDAELADLPDPDRVALTLDDGWYPLERDPHHASNCWRWTAREAVVAFANPGRDVVFYLRVAGRGQEDAPQQISIVAGEEIPHRFLTPADGETIQRIAIGSSALGNAEQVELRIRVSPTFVPASVESTQDARELGVRVLSVAMVAQ